MEVFDKVMAGPDAAGLDPDRFSKRPGDVSCGKADPEDVRAFERALSGADKEASQKASPAQREEKHGPQGGTDFSRAQAQAPERGERSEGKPASGAEVPEDKAARNPAWNSVWDSASNIEKSAQAPDQEAGQNVDPKAGQNIDPKADQNVDLKPDFRLDPKSALKSGESGEMPRANPQEEPRRGSAKALNEEAFLAAMFGRGAEGASALAVNAGAVSPAVAEAADAGAPKGAALGETELSRLVDRILVGSPERGGSEVRLVLNDRVLPGTEIRLARDAAGALQVTIETRDDAAFQTLVGARNDLERALQAAEKGSVSLNMRREGEDEGEAGDMRRRSRGLTEMDDPR